MRPMLAEGPWMTARLARARAFFTGTWKGRILGLALLLYGVEKLAGLGGVVPPAPITIVVRLTLACFVPWLLWRGFRWLSDRLLWRIRTKLIFSYLFIGLVPIVLLAILFVTAGVLLLQISGSRLVAVEVDRISDVTRATAQAAVAGLPSSDDAAAAALRDRLAPVRSLHPGTGWTLLRGGRVAVTEGSAPRRLPSWWKGEPFASLVGGRSEHGPGPALLRVAVSDAEAALLVDVPADERFFAGLERVGIHVVQPSEMKVSEVRRGERRSTASGVVIEHDDKRWETPGLGSVALPPRRDWDTGASGREEVLPIVFHFQPLDFVRRLSPQLPRSAGGFQSLGDVLLLALGVVGLVFLVVYAVALMLGLFLARTITRGVHELSLGTKRVREGDFDHAIPIRSRDQLGELAESFNHMSRGLKQLIAEQAEKQRLEEELRIARQIQMSLLPGEGLVRLSGVRIAALCLPAAEVGGDYYDLLPLGETRMGVLVADVSGKGTSAALYMAELKGLVLSLSRIYESPARLLSEANRILSANMDSRSFVTMTYAVVDTQARCMRYARAGHNPMLHLDARTGKTRVLAPPGLGLGLDAGSRFDRILEEAEVPLAPGDFFLFFTDGLSEAMNEGAELFGEGRLRRILEEAGHLGSDELKDRILAEVRRFVGNAAPHDDMTMVVLKVVEERAA
jgi:serine phosphatase RsbU (regulator of sigma subunit)